MGLLIGEKGVNPTIPLCPYCGKGKNELILTGLAGEEWAKKNGRPDGEMPMYVQLEGDIEPCDECKKRGIAFAQTLEVTRILRKLVHKLEAGLTAGPHIYGDTLLDINGNRVGSFEMDLPEGDEGDAQA